MYSDDLKLVKPIAIFENFLSKNIRLQDKKYDEFSNFCLYVDVIESANGSAMVCLGETIVIAGIKVKVIPSILNCSKVICVIEFSGLCDKTTKLNAPPSKFAQALSSRIQRIIECHVCPDSTEQLKIFSKPDVSGSTFHVGSYLLHLDIIVMQNDGCLADACLPAALACLYTAKWQKLEATSIDTDGHSLQIAPCIPYTLMRLNILDWPIPISFAIVPVYFSTHNSTDQDKTPFIAQPSSKELSIWDIDAGLVTIVINNAGNICDSDIVFSFLSSIWEKIALGSVIQNQNKLLSCLIKAAVDQANIIRCEIKNVLK